MIEVLLVASSKGNTLVLKKLDLNLMDTWLTSVSQKFLNRLSREQTDKIKESCKSAMRVVATVTTLHIGTLIMEKLERMLVHWMEHEYQCVIPLCTVIIQVEVKS